MVWSALASLLGIAAEELGDEIVGAGIEDALGGPDVPILEDPELAPVALAVAAGGPRMADAIAQAYQAGREGRLKDVKKIAKNYGVEDQIKVLERVAKTEFSSLDKAAKLQKILETGEARKVPGNIGPRDPKARKEFLDQEFKKELDYASRASSSADTRAKKALQEAGRLADDVKGAQYLIPEVVESDIPDIPKEALPKKEADFVARERPTALAKELEAIPEMDTRVGFKQSEEGAKRFVPDKYQLEAMLKRAGDLPVEGAGRFAKLAKKYPRTAAVLGGIGGIGGAYYALTGDSDADKRRAEREAKERAEEEAIQKEADELMSNILKKKPKKSSSGKAAGSDRKTKTLQELDNIRNEILNLGR